MTYEFWNNKSVLITGGSGFIGTHLTKALLFQGAKISIMDVSSKMAILFNIFSNNKKLEYKIINIIDLDLLNFFKENDFDIIFHLAGNANVNLSVDDPYLDFNLNVLTSIRLLETLRAISYSGKFIFPSSAAVYGNPMTLPIKEDDPTVPISPYGVSKLTIERYISIYSDLFGLKAASVRPFSVYGPGQKKLVVYDIIRKLYNNPNQLQLFGDGSQLRDFVYIDDVIKAMMLVAEKGKLIGEVYNLATGQEHSIKYLVETLCNLMNVNPKFIFSGSVRLGEPEKWAVSIKKISDLGFIPEISFIDGLQRTRDWYKEETKLTNNPGGN